ncbi:MAG: SDR family NAD(P)-dependent oxidoreductase [Rhodospirillales bacterium]|nr:SDR family NAD(P)-dependent oxidoreductase [Rhodospirillales bacterium]
MSLNGKVVVVTGAAGGFGRVICSSLLEVGAKVIAIDVSTDALEMLKSENTRFQAEMLVTKAIDISDYSQCKTAIEEGATRFSGIDILINNAAVGMGHVRPDHLINLVSIDEITPEIWDKVIGVNLTGPWNMTKCSIDFLRRSKNARIINITTSFFTMLRDKFHPYGPSKSGFEAMSAGHAAEFLPDGITVNVVVPGGPADTTMVPEETGWNREELVKPIMMTYPILWLCSEEAAAVTGYRYVAGHWDPERSIAENRSKTEAPIAWPSLAQDPVWPGGKPS